MQPQTIRTGLTAAMTAGRALLAAGWRYDSTTPMADDTTIRTLLHSSGRQIDARTDDRGGDTTSLTMTGLSLEQVAGALAGAGLAPAAERPTTKSGQVFDSRFHIGSDGLVSVEAPAKPKPDYWLNLADDLRQAADRIATLTGTPKPKNGTRLAFHCGLNDRDHETTRPVVDAIAALFDATTKATPSGAGLRYEAAGKVGELGVWPWAYIPAPDDPEKAAMRAELEQLRAQLAAPTNPDRRCRRCGATSGLKRLPGNPLTLAAREWQCWDDCRDSAR